MNNNTKCPHCGASPLKVSGRLDEYFNDQVIENGVLYISYGKTTSELGEVHCQSCKKDVTKVVENYEVEW